MSIEPTPAVVYSTQPALTAVLAVLRATPDLVDLVADGPDDDWRTVHLSIGDPRAVRKLVVRNDPSHWSRPGFDLQVQGMQQFLARSGVDRITGPMIEALPRLGFAVSIAADDGQREPYLHDDDPAGRLVSALAHHLDGVIFWISALFDHRYRMLLGGSAQHPEVQPPSWMPHPPDAPRVARRLLVLLALHIRAQLEYLDDGAVDREHERTKLLDWIARGGFADEFSPDETSPQVPCGALEAGQANDDWWRIEGATILAWALGLGGYPPDAPADAIEALAEIAGWPSGVPGGLVERATVRHDAELRAAQNHQFFWHWRFVDQQVAPRHMDFAELGRSAGFGRFEASEFRLVEQDLAVGDVPISRAEPQVLAGFASAAAERHRAVNWLRHGRSYGETDIST